MKIKANNIPFGREKLVFILFNSKYLQNRDVEMARILESYKLKFRYKEFALYQEIIIQKFVYLIIFQFFPLNDFI